MQRAGEDHVGCRSQDVLQRQQAGPGIVPREPGEVPPRRPWHLVMQQRIAGADRQPVLVYQHQVAKDQVCFFGGSERCRSLEPAGHKAVVAVEDCHPFGLRCRNQLVQPGMGAVVAVGWQDAQPWPEMGQVRQQRLRPVGRAVIDDQHLRHERRAECGQDTLGEVRPVVEARDADGEHG